MGQRYQNETVHQNWMNANVAGLGVIGRDRYVYPLKGKTLPFAFFSGLALLLFNKNDQLLLTYLNEDGKRGFTLKVHDDENLIKKLHDFISNSLVDFKTCHGDQDGPGGQGGKGAIGGGKISV
ncbi:unnamed protein product [Rotaria sp. Silwood1]|nr:unnamed protein product [Rotaria sp. Silwood1]CAF3354934.1 unnamed protein product [Rotaria sp. Silwood1]CAF3382283.1 unnamed protein product [Rotaria sp. Silwood1]